MKPFAWQRARNAADAARAAGEGAALKAGGVDLVDRMKEGLAEPRRIVDVRSIPGLGRIGGQLDGSLRIGAAVTLTELAAHPLVRSRYRALAQAVGGSASPQIRNVATIGGNLLQRPRCWYFRSREHLCARKGGASCFAFAGENQYHALFGQNGCAIVHPSTPATALVAFDARVELLGPGGRRRVLPLEEFFVGPERDITREHDLRSDEVLVAVLLPHAREARSAHMRQGELDSFDWPLADVAVVLEMAGESCRRAGIVLGAAAPIPHRAAEAEGLLAGRRIDEPLARAAARAAMSKAAPLSGNGYKVPIFEALIRRAILEAASKA